MNRQQNIFRNKKGNNSNRSISAICFSLVAFIFGPVISLFLVFGTTTILNMNLGLNDLITTTPYNMIISMLGYPIILYLLIIINSKLYDGDLSKFGFSSKRKYVRILKGIGLGIGLVVGLYLLSLIFLALYSITNNKFNFLIMFLFVIGFFIQGMVEEILMRSIIMNEICNKSNAAIAILTNSLLFSLLHLSAPGVTALSFFNLFLFGIMFSLIYYITNDMWLTGFAHAAWNITLGVILGTEISGQVIENSLFRTSSTPYKSLLSGGDFGLEGGLIMTIFTTFVILTLIFSTKIIKTKRSW